MQTPFITTVIIVLGATIMVILERFRPYTPGQRLFRKGFHADFVWYTVAQSYVLGLIIFAFISAIDSGMGWHRWDGVRSLPIWVQCIVALIVHDLYIYWFHRLQHHHPFLWKIHEAHHSNDEVDWLSGSRSHPLEILINQTIEFLPLVLLASPEVPAIKGCIDALWGMYIHSNIDVRSGSLQYVINGPEMHRWHHAHDDEAHNKNFSTKLAIWDWLFGTAYRPVDRKPAAYGLGGWYPTSYLRQVIYAFRRQQRTNDH